MLRRLAPLVLVLALLPPAAAQARTTVDVPEAFGSQVADAGDASGLRVLLPHRMTVDFDEVFPAERSRSGRYLLDLGAVEGCNGANVCFVASFEGRRGKRLGGGREVRLAKGRAGRFKPVRCGASCGPALIKWREGGVRYRIAAKGLLDGKNERRGLRKLANQAIRAGAR